MEQLSEQRSGQPVRPIHDIHRRAVLAETARTPLEGYEVSLRRYSPVQKGTAGLPWPGVAYELRLRSTRWEESREYGGRSYERLVRIELESYNPRLDTTERFTLACGTQGELAGVPVYVKYQPKWWFKAEGVLDEAQRFETDGGERSATARTEAHHDDSR